MSNFFNIVDSNLECGLSEYKNIMDHVSVDHLIFNDDTFYKLSSHPVIHDVFKDEEFNTELDNPEFIVYKSGNDYHIYIERSENDLTGWVYSSNSDDVEKLGSVPTCYLNPSFVPFSNFNKIKKGKIKDIDNDGDKVFDLIKENVIL